jgi:hypothetical protein
MVREFVSAVALVLLAGCGASISPDSDANNPPLADAWEVPSPTVADDADCTLVEPPLIGAVHTSLRAQSTAALADVPVVELTEGEAARLIAAPRQNDAPLAPILLANFLDEMRERKHRAEVESRDSWSVADENELVALSARYAAGGHRSYRPYLVRAVAKHEGTGGFYAKMCGRDLHVSHGSLGRTIPPSTRVPLVIYLNRQPDRVFATWSIAE